MFGFSPSQPTSGGKRQEEDDNSIVEENNDVVENTGGNARNTGVNNESGTSISVPNADSKDGLVASLGRLVEYDRDKKPVEIKKENFPIIYAGDYTKFHSWKKQLQSVLLRYDKVAWLVAMKCINVYPGGSGYRMKRLPSITTVIKALALHAKADSRFDESNQINHLEDLLYSENKENYEKRLANGLICIEELILNGNLKTNMVNQRLQVLKPIVINNAISCIEICFKKSTTKQFRELKKFFNAQNNEYD